MQNNIFISIGIGVVLGIVAFSSSINDDGVGYALFYAYVAFSVPFGWRALNSITPQVFLILPLIGWLFYFGFKAALACVVGVFVAPFQIVKAIRER